MLLFQINYLCLLTHLSGMTYLSLLTCLFVLNYLSVVTYLSVMTYLFVMTYLSVLTNLSLLTYLSVLNNLSLLTSLSVLTCLAMANLPWLRNDYIRFLLHLKKQILIFLFSSFTQSIKTMFVLLRYYCTSSWTNYVCFLFDPANSGLTIIIIF
jgi:hypothetical protein